MLDPPFHALGVDVSAAAEFTVSHIIIFIHRFIANATSLIRIKFSLRYVLLLLLENIRSTQYAVNLIVNVPQIVVMFVQKILGLLVQCSLGIRAIVALRSHGETGTVNGTVATFEDLLDLAIDEGKLPDEGVSLVHFEDANQAENRVDTMLSSTSAATALDLAANLNFKFLIVLIFDGQLGGAVLLH